jgi:hypothetical protein
MSDPINPSHYKHLPAEAIDIIDAAIEGAPSPQAAAAQSHLLGYALRANQKGQLAIDAGKAEWYAARWLKAIREAETKAIPASETPSNEPTFKPSKTQPPSGYRLLGPAKDEPRIEGDQYWSLAIKGWTVLTNHKVEYANQHDWLACRKIVAPAGKPSEPVEIPKGFIEEFIDLLREPIKPPPKRHRDPTQADLRDGPIACEYRDNDDEQWRSGLLVYILDGSMPFLCTDKMDQFSGQWNQCRIEVAE